MFQSKETKALAAISASQCMLGSCRVSFFVDFSCKGTKIASKQGREREFLSMSMEKSYFKVKNKKSDSINNNKKKRIVW